MSNTLSNPVKTLPFTETLIDKRALAAFLGMSESGITKLIERGVAPPHLRVGRLCAGARLQSFAGVRISAPRPNRQRLRGSRP
jgi:predicted DNA-binding transcriptional regulator AlpA